MNRASSITVCLLVAVVCANALSYTDVRGTPYSVSYDHRAIVINGQRQLLLSGSIHYPRSTPGMWGDLMSRTVAGGLNTIQVYVFWNYHEAAPGVYDFSTGNRNLTQFLTEAANAGLWVVLRIGPYVCAEWDYGGLPYWLRDDPNMVFRDNDESWKREMARFMSVSVQLAEPFLARNGGPIILLQTENEYGNVESNYGANGTAYVKWNGELAASMDTDTPWIMCQQSDAPEPIINTCNGFYCDNWIAGHVTAYPKQPSMWTENWPGWFQHWGEPVPHRPVQDVSFAVARWIARGGTHQNYYMWHGGTTFGRWTGGPLIITSYDYDVALNEYGLPAQPKYDHSARLHSILQSYSNLLLTFDTPQPIPLGLFQEAHVYGDAISNDRVIFLSNIDSVNNVTVNFNNTEFVLPAWSVSIVDGRTMLVQYNTAVIQQQQDQSSPQAEAGGKGAAADAAVEGIATPPVVATPQPTRTAPKPDALRVRITTADTQISYIAEPIGGWTKQPPITSQQPLEQLSLTHDTTDYLWYTTLVTIPANAPGAHVYLVLNDVQDYVYVYLNGTYIASSLGSDITLPSIYVPIPANAAVGSQLQLQLLVLTQGLINYGPFLERWTRGVQNSVIWAGQDVTRQTWGQTPALEGEYFRYFTAQGAANAGWIAGVAAPGLALVWYRIMLDTPNPLPPDSVWALDLGGMGKGAAYINGQALGRYWSIVAANGNACAPCDYRGTFDPLKCRTGCGEPSQRYYHVPRDWLAPAGQPNLIVLIEETAQLNADPTTIQLVAMN